MNHRIRRRRHRKRFQNIRRQQTLQETASSTETSLLQSGWVEIVALSKVQLGRCLLSLLEERSRNGCVFLPVLKTLNLVFSHRHLDNVVQSEGGFAGHFLQALQRYAASKDVSCLVAIADVTIVIQQQYQYTFPTCCIPFSQILEVARIDRARLMVAWFLLCYCHRLAAYATKTTNQQ